MKRPSKDFMIIILVVLLVWSIILNILQDSRVDRLFEKMQEMEDTQTMMSDTIDALEEWEQETFGADEEIFD